MAVRLSLSDVDLSCPICCEIFKEPVVLKCSHSFCASCLQEYWRRGGNRECPLCRSRSTDDPVPSLTLRNLCQSCVEEGGAEEREAGRELAIPSGEMCPLHEERLKLFCTVDDEPICVVCHTSRRHKAHDCCPVSEAVEGVKVNTVTDCDQDDDDRSGLASDLLLMVPPQERMKSALSILQQKKDAFDKTKRNYEETVTCIQVKSESELSCFKKKEKKNTPSLLTQRVLCFRNRLGSWSGGLERSLRSCTPSCAPRRRANCRRCGLRRSSGDKPRRRRSRALAGISSPCPRPSQPWRRTWRWRACLFCM